MAAALEKKENKVSDCTYIVERLLELSLSSPRAVV
jgi:hypothetical protein